MTFVAQRVALQDILLLCNGDLHHYELKFLHCEVVPFPVKEQLSSRFREVCCETSASRVFQPVCILS